MSAPRLSGFADDGDGLDFTERAGFAVGRQAALREWSFWKEQDADRQLFARLYARNWARNERARNPEKVRARLQAWRDRNREKLRARERELRAAKRATRTPRLIACAVCGTKRIVLRLVTGRAAAKYCSKLCRERASSKRRSRDGRRNRGIRCMTIVPTILGALAGVPAGLELKELVAACPALKRNSIATTLCQLVKAGRVRAEGTFGGRGAGRHGRRYVLKEVA